MTHMSIHFGSKKIKEMYWGGRKIKEAWYEGKKVYGSAPAGSYRGEWRIGVDYAVGDTVTYTHGATYTFKCIKSHSSNLDNEPYGGILEALYWEFA